MKTKSKIYENGLKVVCYNSKKIDQNFATFLIKVGNIYEKKDQKEISHFLEHCLFCGSGSLKTYDDVIKKMAELEVLDFSFTEDEYMRISFSFENLKKTLPFIWNLIFFPIFNKKCIKKEKQILVSEKNKYLNNNHNIFYQKIFSKLFKGNLLNLDLNLKNLKGFSKSDLEKFHKKFFKYENITISFSLREEEKEIFSFIEEKIFNKKKDLKKIDKIKYPEILINKINDDQKLFVSNNFNYCSFIFYLPLKNLEDSNFYFLLKNYLKENFRKNDFSRKLGVCSLGVSIYEYNKFSILDINTSIDKESFKIFKKNILSFFKNHEVNKEIFEKSLKKIILNNKKSLSSSKDISQYLAYSFSSEEKPTTLESENIFYKKMSFNKFKKKTEKVFKENRPMCFKSF